MIKYFLMRILQLVPVLIGVTFIVFLLTYIAPGDPARMILPQEATEQEVLQMRHNMGLDRPFIVQYFSFLFGYDGPGEAFDYKGLIFLDFGRSYVTNRPVFEVVLERFQNTAVLAFFAFIFSVVISIPFGINLLINLFAFSLLPRSPERYGWA